MAKAEENNQSIEEDSTTLAVAEVVHSKTHRKKIELAPGQILYRAQFDESEAATYVAEFISRNMSFYTLKNPKTGETWRERGLRWYASELEAVENLIDWMCIGRFASICNPKTKMEPDWIARLASACHLHQKLSKKTS